MSTQSRKQRQLAEREQVFLDRAWAMVKNDGVLNLQMSRLAAECEYAVGTLYLHFSSKEDLLVALASSRVGERIELFRRAAAWQAPTRHRMFAIVLADMLFAQQSPEFFHLAQYVSTQTVWAAATVARRADALAKSEPLSTVVRGVIDEAIYNGDVDSQGLSGRELSSGLWAMCVGMHALAGAGGLLETQCEPGAYRLLQFQINILLNGLEWQPLMPMTDATAQRQLTRQIMSELFPEFIVTAESGALTPLARNFGDGPNE
ncbi:MAG: TetR/AcrR family transcriptional regulator [Spongiibacteraceae bacterium]